MNFFLDRTAVKTRAPKALDWNLAQKSMEQIRKRFTSNFAVIGLSADVTFSTWSAGLVDNLIFDSAELDPLSTFNSLANFVEIPEGARFYRVSFSFDFTSTGYAGALFVVPQNGAPGMDIVIDMNRDETGTSGDLVESYSCRLPWVPLDPFESNQISTILSFNGRGGVSGPTVSANAQSWFCVEWR